MVAILKVLKLEDIIYLTELLIIIITSSRIRKRFYDQPIDSDINWYEESRKLRTVQGEDYITGCALHHDYIKYHYRFIAVDLIRKKILRCWSKSNWTNKTG